MTTKKEILERQTRAGYINVVDVAKGQSKNDALKLLEIFQSVITSISPNAKMAIDETHRAQNTVRMYDTANSIGRLTAADVRKLEDRFRGLIMYSMARIPNGPVGSEFEVPYTALQFQEDDEGCENNMTYINHPKGTTDVISSIVCIIFIVFIIYYLIRDILPQLT